MIDADKNDAYFGRLAPSDLMPDPDSVSADPLDVAQTWANARADEDAKYAALES